jgi:hypothetical protein
VRFMSEVDVLILPTSLMPAFDVSIRYPSVMKLPADAPASAGGERAESVRAFKTYTEWMLPCVVVSLAGLPAISVPVTTSSGGLPIGVQLVGRPGGEAALLAAAALLERAVHRTGMSAGGESAAAASDGDIAGGSISGKGGAGSADGDAEAATWLDCNGMCQRRIVEPTRRAPAELRPWEWDGPRTAHEAAVLHGFAAAAAK